jgi:hypothetical protein
VLVPEVVRQLDDARVQQVGIFQHVVVEVVLGRQAQRARLDAHVDVFRHQHDGAAFLLRFQRTHHGQDLVVGLAGRQPTGSSAVCRRVWKYRRPLASLLPSLDSGMPFSMASSSVLDTSASSVRETWRALRATSVMPFLWLSSSSSVIIGR